MKSLFALLVLGLGLGAVYWKTQHPEATIDDIKQSAGAGVDRLKVGFDAVKNSGSQNNSSTTQLGADSETVTAEIASLNSRVDLLNRRIEEQSNNVDTGSIEQKLEQLNTQIDQLQETQQLVQSEQTGKIDLITEKVSDFEARLNTLSTDTSTGQAESSATINAQIDQRLAQMEQKFATTNSDSARIAQLTEVIDSSRKHIAQLEGKNNEVQNTIATLKESISELQTRTESISIDELQSKISTQLASLQSQIEKDGGHEQSEMLTAELAATRNRLNQLEQRVVDLPASSNEADSALQAQNALQSQIASLETRLASLNTNADSELVDSLTQVQEQVTELAARSYVTQEDLEAQKQSENVEYKIYFERNSTAVTEAAAKVLDSFIAQEKNRTTAVSIYGFTDRRGSAQYNQRLALQRATNVRSYLIKNGFDYKKIKSLSGLGEDAAAASIDDGAEDALQRAVVLYAAQP